MLKLSNLQIFPVKNVFLNTVILAYLALSRTCNRKYEDQQKTEAEIQRGIEGSFTGYLIADHHLQIHSKYLFRGIIYHLILR